MYNMFIRSCGSLPAGPPQVGITLIGSSKELGRYHGGFRDLRQQRGCSVRRRWAGILVAKMWLKYRDDSTSIRIDGGAMLQRIGSHSVFVGLRVPDTVLIVAFNCTSMAFVGALANQTGEQYSAIEYMRVSIAVHKVLTLAPHDVPACFRMRFTVP